MRLKKDSSEQKLRGAYYTPLQLADAMVELFASQNISTVLEPSCGDGVFLDALQNLNLLNKVDKLTAVEIEPDEADKVRDRYSEFEQIEVCTEDFFDFYNAFALFNDRSRISVAAADFAHGESLSRH